ncbi:MAG: hypothetical protein IJV58_03930 [Oscillospiraceae bacterium]|nr:hypothetical protein [Oscillospiraceae bacterium]
MPAHGRRGACPHTADAHIGVLWSGISCPRSGSMYRNAPACGEGAKRIVRCTA